MKPLDLVSNEEPKALLASILSKLHEEGPVNQELLETLAYLKRFHPDALKSSEAKLMYLLGLFYKTTEPSDLLSLSYSIFQESIEAEFKTTLTPIQARIQRQILDMKIFSFSAPTSTGKSYILRELIHKINSDIVIVLPSRALISEYLLAVRNIVRDNKEILVLQFVDDINRAKTKRRIFIITPERGAPLFRLKRNFNIGLFIFDEAQISEAGLRGLTFDALVRRVERTFPTAKKAFVHPFVENPQAQLNKHGYHQEATYQVFKQNAVGKIFAEVDPSRPGFWLFSPYIESPHLKRNKHYLERDIVRDVLRSEGSILVYVAKKFIYEQRYREEFNQYIALCPPITDPEANAIIDEIESLIGASKEKSEMVALMRRGIIIHHGSVPLVVRYLIEDFANKRFARICFATSTLAQGVNIPFDLVWIHNLRFFGSKENKTLGLKNLIGRAGRSSQYRDSFDYGYVVVPNAKSFTDLFAGRTELKDISVLDYPDFTHEQDVDEFIAAVKEETIDDIYALPLTKVERLAAPETQTLINQILDSIFSGERLISGDEYQELDDARKVALKSAFARIFEISLNRELGPGEKSILSTAIAILLWQIQGRSFRTLIGLRHSYLTERTRRREINRRFRSGKLSELEKDQELEKVMIHFSPIATQLPSKGAPAIPLFRNLPVSKFNYDLLVYDTYDYLDKVISFSLSDIFIAAFGQHYSRTQDQRAAKFVNFLKYGTNNPNAILLMRYGFSPDNLEAILPHIKSISEQGIEFTSTSTEITDEFDSYLVKHYQ